MVSTSFVREVDINLRLPQAQTEASIVVPALNILEISVTESGNYLVNGSLLADNQRGTLSSFIEGLMGDNREQPVFIRADAQATHQAVVTVMDVVGQLGFVEISIATVSPPEA